MHHPQTRRRFLARGVAFGAAASLSLSTRGTAAQPGRAAPAAIDAALRRAVEAKEVPGVVAAAANDRGLLYEGSFGSRDIAKSTPMTADTIFRIASMTKAVTAAAVMMLIEDGKLRLDAPAERWLPELANRRVLRRLDGPLTDTVPAVPDPAA